MSMAITGQRLTLDEFLALPEEKPYLEYVDGVVRQKMSPTNRHGRFEGELFRRFDGAGDRSDPLVAFVEVRVTFAGRSTVPDVVAMRSSRVQVDADGYVVDYTTVPPDLVVEIASPGQSRADQDERCRWFIRNGVVALRVDPQRQTVRVFRAASESGELIGSDVIDLEDVAPGLRFTVDEVFAVLRPRRPT
jgi:Uma2 family endonuclease